MSIQICRANLEKCILLYLLWTIAILSVVGYGFTVLKHFQAEVEAKAIQVEAKAKAMRLKKYSDWQAKKWKTSPENPEYSGYNPNRLQYKPLLFRKGMDYQEVRQIWLSKGYTIRDAREYNNYNETGEVTLIFNPGPNCMVFNFKWWTLQDWTRNNCNW